MVIAHDAIGTFGATPDTASPMSWTHTPGGTPRGIVVLIVTNDTTDTITSVTYGGTAMARVRWQNVGGENGSAYAYFLGSSVPTGAQTVTVNFTGANNHGGCSISVTAAGDTAVEHHLGLANTSLANPSITLTTSATTITYGALYDGVAAPSSITPDGNHTDVQELDLGAESASMIRRSGTVAAGSPVVGWTVAADDVAAVALAIKEVATYLISIAATGVGASTLSRVATFPKTMAATNVGVAALSKVATFPKTLAATTVGAAALIRTQYVTLAATSVGAAGLSFAKLFTQTLAAVAVGVATMAQSVTFNITQAATAVGAATLSMAITFAQTLAATAVGVATLVAQFIAGTRKGKVYPGNAPSPYGRFPGRY